MTYSRPEFITLWKAKGFGASGEVLVSDAPDEYSVRWEDGVLEVLSPDATPIASQATIFIDDAKIPMGSLVWRGEKRKLPETPYPIYRIVAIESAYDLKGRYTNTSYLLSIFGKNLPIMASD